MLPDKYITITMSFDDISADLMAILSDAVTGDGLSKDWSTTSVPRHTDNDWHTVRDLLIEWIGEAF